MNPENSNVSVKGAGTNCLLSLPAALQFQPPRNRAGAAGLPDRRWSPIMVDYSVISNLKITLPSDMSLHGWPDIHPVAFERIHT